jgi:hypothetical protein
MASVSSPYGAQVISDNTGTVRGHRIPLGIASGYAANIFKDMPVKMIPSGNGASSGTLQAVTNPGGTPDAIFGFFAGVEYTPVGGRPVVSPFWPSGTTYDTGYQMFVYITPAWLPGLRVRVQADGSVAQALMGSSFNFTNLTAGSTATGLSNCTVGAAGVAAGSQGQLTLIEFSTDVGDPFGGGDAYTDLICEIAYPQIGPRGQNSIG